MPSKSHIKRRATAMATVSATAMATVVMWAIGSRCVRARDGRELWMMPIMALVVVMSLRQFLMRAGADDVEDNVVGSGARTCRRCVGDDDDQGLYAWCASTRTCVRGGVFAVSNCARAARRRAQCRDVRDVVDVARLGWAMDRVRAWMIARKT